MGDMTASPSVVSALAMTLASLSYDFADDELAYLTLTSRGGVPVRDRISWRLQQELDETYVVARGWRRADIAVLARDTPVLQVATRALPAPDVLDPGARAEHVAALVADGLRMTSVAPDSSAYLLALMTHVDGTVPDHLAEHVVKHAVDTVSAGDDDTSVADRARKLWEAELGRFGWPSTRFTVGGGSLWGLAVEMDAYLIGPLPQA